MGTRRRDGHAFGARSRWRASSQCFFGRSSRRGRRLSRRFGQGARRSRASDGARSEWVVVVGSGAPISPRKAKGRVRPVR
eukprot:6113963-Prymnesium_polylepis.1